LVQKGGTNTCPDCGSVTKTLGKKIETVDADLKELNKKKASVADIRGRGGITGNRIVIVIDRLSSIHDSP